MAGTISIYASSSPWIPEDDLLLKNSIEAGASLEALAKGAVQFSRGFTLRELRDRWHSLLYDPDVSSQASSRMMELELSGSNSSSKLNRSDNCKNAGVVAKRKIVSIRRQYNAMRKKLRTELFNSNDIGFLEPNLHDCNGRAGDFQEHVNLDNGPGDTNCMLRGCISDHFGLQDSDFDILHQVFPQPTSDIGTTSVDNPGNGYQIECQNPIDDNPSITNAREDNLYGFRENIPRLIGDDGRGSFGSDIDQKEASHMLPDDSINFENFTSTNTLDPLQKLPSQFEADDSLIKRSPVFHSMNENPQNMGSGFGGRHINSPDSDGNASLHAMGFSSPMPRLPLWKTMEDISVPDMPVHMNDRDITQGVEEALALPDKSEHRGESPAGFDVVHSEPLLGDSDSGNCFSSGVVSEGEFVDLSDSLLNFPNEDELLFMDVDGKDQMDTSCYDNVNSLIISSPSDTITQEGVFGDIQPSKLNHIEPISTLSSTCAGTISSPLVTDSKNIISSLHHDGQQGILDSEINEASTSMLCPDSPQLIDEIICCVLNTEDTEIPCNDDIFLLIHPTKSFAPARKPFTIDPIEPATSADEKDNERCVNLMKKVKDPAQKFTRPSATVPNKLPESFPGLPVVTCKVKSEIPDTKSLSLHPGEVRKTIRDLSQTRAAIATTCTSADGVVEKDVIKAEPGVLDKPSASTSRELVLYAEAGTVKMALPETVSNPSASEQDESESENDVPYFSDIEAMILEMDLGPYGQDSYTTKQVSKYQDEDAKKKIIRLEQCARSSLQRTMSSHGALAFLYGRHLKYYMKKTEVLLGRSTDDVDVDIDLRKEGRANKISRRQATIKMETDGAFFLKNLGKSSISVNGKAVACEQSLCLSSSSLIEIKGMSFVFEINHKYVRLYLDTITKKSQHNKSKLECSLGQET